MLTQYQQAQAISMTERALRHYEAGTTDLESAIFRVPLERYADEGLWRDEMEAIFKRLPLLLGFTCEMRKPGDYKTMQILDVPVLMVRGKDGKMRAFINVCSHRGAILATEGKGNCSGRFICPYHAWTFNDRGDLTGIATRSRFGDVDKVERHLKELPCEERGGLIFVCLTPGRAFDLEEFLGQMLLDLESYGFENWYMHAQGELESANWKITHDGYLETYHVQFLHATTLAHMDSGGRMVFDSFGPLPFGPHQRMSGVGNNIEQFFDKPQSEWTADELFFAIRTVFPNISFAMGHGGGMVSQLIPVAPDRCITIQNIMFPRPPANAEEIAEYDAMVELNKVAVRDEDYLTGLNIQKGLHSGANKDFLFGRNEVGPQRWHKSVQHYYDMWQAEQLKLERRAD